MNKKEITDEATARLLLAKTGIDNLLQTTDPRATAIFGAHSDKDSVIALLHKERVSIFHLTGNLQDRLAEKARMEDILRQIENIEKFEGGNNVEFHRNDWERGQHS